MVGAKTKLRRSGRVSVQVKLFQSPFVQPTRKSTQRKPSRPTPSKTPKNKKNAIRYDSISSRDIMSSSSDSVISSQSLTTTNSSIRLFSLPDPFPDNHLIGGSFLRPPVYNKMQLNQLNPKQEYLNHNYAPEYFENQDIVPEVPERKVFMGLRNHRVQQPPIMKREEVEDDDPEIICEYVNEGSSRNWIDHSEHGLIDLETHKRLLEAILNVILAVKTEHHRAQATKITDAIKEIESRGHREATITGEEVRVTATAALMGLTKSSPPKSNEDGRSLKLFLAQFRTACNSMGFLHDLLHDTLILEKSLTFEKLIPTDKIRTTIDTIVNVIAP